MNARRWFKQGMAFMLCICMVLSTNAMTLVAETTSEQSVVQSLADVSQTVSADAIETQEETVSETEESVPEPVATDEDVAPMQGTAMVPVEEDGEVVAQKSVNTYLYPLEVGTPMEVQMSSDGYAECLFTLSENNASESGWYEIAADDATYVRISYTDENGERHDVHSNWGGAKVIHLEKGKDYSMVVSATAYSKHEVALNRFDIVSVTPDTTNVKPSYLGDSEMQTEGLKLTVLLSDNSTREETVEGNTVWGGWIVYANTYDDGVGYDSLEAGDHTGHITLFEVSFDVPFTLVGTNVKSVSSEVLNYYLSPGGFRYYDKSVVVTYNDDTSEEICLNEAFQKGLKISYDEETQIYTYDDENGTMYANPVNMGDAFLKTYMGQQLNYYFVYNGYEFAVPIVICEVPIKDVSIQTLPKKLNYTEGADSYVDVSGLEFLVTNTDETTYTVTSADYWGAGNLKWGINWSVMQDGSSVDLKLLEAGNYNVSCYLYNYECDISYTLEYPITIIESPIKSISANCTGTPLVAKKGYMDGMSLDDVIAANIKIDVYGENNTSFIFDSQNGYGSGYDGLYYTITYDGMECKIDFSSVDFDETGDYNATVSYGNCETELLVTVEDAPAIKSIRLKDADYVCKLYKNDEVGFYIPYVIEFEDGSEKESNIYFDSWVLTQENIAQYNTSFSTGIFVKLDYQNVKIDEVGKYVMTLSMPKHDMSVDIPVEVFENSVASISLDVPESEKTCLIGTDTYLDIYYKTLTIAYMDGSTKEIAIENWDTFMDPVIGREVYFNYGIYNEENDCYERNIESVAAKVGEYTVVFSALGKEYSYTFTVKDPSEDITGMTWSPTNAMTMEVGSNHHFRPNEEDITLAFKDGSKKTVRDVAYYYDEDWEEYEGIEGMEAYRRWEVSLTDKAGNVIVEPSLYSMRIPGTVEPGEYQVVLELLGQKVTKDFTVLPNPIQSIEVLSVPEKGEFYQFDALDADGLTFKVHYTDGTVSEVIGNKYYDEDDEEWYGGWYSGGWCYFNKETEDGNRSFEATLGIDSDDYYEEGLGDLSPGTYGTYIECNGIRQDIEGYELTILENPVESIELVTPPTKTNYIPSEFDGISGRTSIYGATIKVNCIDGTSKEIKIEDADDLEQEFGRITYSIWVGSGRGTISYAQRSVEFEVGTQVDTDSATELFLDEPVQTIIEDECRLFSFTPEVTDTYYFYSLKANNASIDTAAALLDENKEIIAENDDGRAGGGCQFMITKELTAGVTYYLAAGTLEYGDSGSFMTCVSDMPYDPEVTWKTIKSVRLELDVPKHGHRRHSHMEQKDFKNGEENLFYDVDGRWDDSYDEYFTPENGIKYLLSMFLRPYEGYRFNTSTTIYINGKRPKSKKIDANGRMEVVYEAPSTDYKITLPKSTDYKVNIVSENGISEATDAIVTPGGRFTFTVSAAETEAAKMIVKLGSDVLTATNTETKDGQITNTYTCENIDSNAEVSVKLEPPVAAAEEYLLTYYNKGKFYDSIAVEEDTSLVEQGIQLPKIASYTAVNGLDQFFYGWYESQDSNNNGSGTRFKRVNPIEKDTNLYAKWMKGILEYSYKGMILTYKMLSVDDSGKVKTQVSLRNPKVDDSQPVAQTAGEDDVTLEVPGMFTTSVDGVELDFEVVAIADIATEETESAPVTKVVLPNTVTKIEENAFAGLDDLKQVAIPDSVEEISEGAFGTSEEETPKKVEILCSPQLEGEIKDVLGDKADIKKVDITLDYNSDVLDLSYGEEPKTITATISVSSNSAETEEIIDGSNAVWTLTGDAVQMKDNKNGSVELSVLESSDDEQILTVAYEGISKQIIINANRKDLCDDEDFEYPRIPEQIYTGSQVKPSIGELKDGDYVLKEGVDYTISYGKNIEEYGYVYVEFLRNYQYEGETEMAVYFEIAEPVITPPAIGGDDDKKEEDKKPSVTPPSTLPQPTTPVGPTVAPPEDKPVVVEATNIKLEAKTLKMKKGSKLKKIEVTFTPENTTDKNLTWKSSNTKVVKVDSKGVIKAVGVGKAKVTATTSNGKTATVTITVSKKNVKVTKIKITGESKTLKKGKTMKLTAKVTPITATKAKVKWKSSNTKIATINSKGVVKAKKPGKVTITATATDGSKKKATYKITVKK